MDIKAQEIRGRMYGAGDKEENFWDRRMDSPTPRMRPSGTSGRTCWLGENKEGVPGWARRNRMLGVGNKEEVIQDQ